MYRFVIRPLLKLLLFLVAFAVAGFVFYVGPKNIMTTIRGVSSGKLDMQMLLTNPKPIGQIDVTDKWGIEDTEPVYALAGTPIQQAYESLMQSKEVLLFTCNYQKDDTLKQDANFDTTSPVNGKWTGTFTLGGKPVAKFVEDGSNYQVLSLTPMH